MRKDLRYTYLSRPRYNRYLAATANDKERAKKLYNANIRLAQSFHPILSQFEVILRNSLNLKLSAHFGDIDWIINHWGIHISFWKLVFKKVKINRIDDKSQ